MSLSAATVRSDRVHGASGAHRPTLAIERLLPPWNVPTDVAPPRFGGAMVDLKGQRPLQLVAPACPRRPPSARLSFILSRNPVVKPHWISLDRDAGFRKIRPTP
jgi:hypothetical protein